jgi:protein Mpv17
MSTRMMDDVNTNNNPDETEFSDSALRQKTQEVLLLMDQHQQALDPTTARMSQAVFVQGSGSSKVTTTANNSENYFDNFFRSTDPAVAVAALMGAALLLMAWGAGGITGQHELGGMPMMWHGWSLREIVTRIPIDLWGQYSHVLADHPVLTKACTSATVYTIGDVIAQKTAIAAAAAAEGTGDVVSPDLDLARVARSMIAGLIGHGPLSHCWYNFCDNLFEHTLHCTAWWSVFPKVVIDQTVWGPIWNNTYIILLGLMRLQRPAAIWADVQRTTVPLIVSGLKLWPAAHMVTYGLIPTENRLLWVDLVEILWVTILATQASDGGHPPPST